MSHSIPPALAPLILPPSCRYFRSTNRVTGQRKPKPSSSAKSSCDIAERRTFNLSLRDGSLIWKQLKSDEQKTVLPIMYGALGAWWAFIVYRIVQAPSAGGRL